MTTAILKGKPYAGNPHVRFDEGEVASTKPRRGSLLYKKLLLAVSAGVAMIACSSFADEDKQIYSLNATTTEGVDLTAMEGYHADRMYGPSSADISFAGPIVAGPEVTADNPLVVLGRGKKITVTADSSGFHTQPLKLCNADGVTETSTLQFNAGNFSMPSLDIGRYNKFASSWYNNGNQQYATAKVSIHDGGALSGYGHKIGTNQTNLEMRVTSGGKLSGDYLYLGHQSASLGQGVYPTASLYVSNATVSVSKVGSPSDGKSLSLMYDCSVADDTVDNCWVTLAKDGVISAPVTRHMGGGRSHVLFDGGRYKSTSTTNIALFVVYGHTYEGGWLNPKMYLEGVNGNPIDIDISADRNLASGDVGSRQINVVGTGGFTKRGDGTLAFTCPNSSTCTYTGPTTIQGGGIVVKNATYKPGRGALSVSDGCFFDLNGFSCEFASATGAGVVTNGSETASTLTLGYGDASGAFELGTVGGPVNLAKTGAGTLTVSGAALANAGDLTISAGTVKFADDSTSYGTVSVALGATLDIRGVVFACAKLNAAGRILSDSDSLLTLDVPTGEETLNAAVAGYVGGLEKCGAGTLDLFGGANLNGAISVREGVMRVRPSVFTGKYFKLQLHKGQSEDDKQWHKRLSEFQLLDADGNNLSTSITAYNATRSDSGSGLAEATARLSKSGYFENIGETEVLNLFDGNLDTEMNDKSGWGNEYVIFRLPATTPDVVGYRIHNRSKIGRLVSWCLYGSADGTNWTVLDDHICSNWDDMDARAAATALTPALDNAWYNGGAPYSLAAYVTGGMVFGSGAVVSVATDATLDLVSVDQALSRISVDCAAGAGTITRFTPAANGVLELVNIDAAQLKNAYALPLSVGELAQRANLKSWTVKVNGEPVARVRVTFKNGQLLVGPPVGLILVIR